MREGRNSDRVSAGGESLVKVEGLSTLEQQLMSEFLAACDQLADRIEGMVPKDDTDRRVKMRYAFYFAKGVSTFRAFAVLARGGFIREGELLSRANLELVIDLLCFHQSPVEYSLQLEDWLGATNCGLPLASDDERRANMLLRNEFCARYGLKKFPTHWSGLNKIAERAKAVGFDTEYSGHYRSQCDLAHCGTFAIASYLDYYSRPDAVLLKTGPDWEEACLAISSACTWLWYCLRAVDEGLELSSYDLIHALYVRLQESSRLVQDAADHRCAVLERALNLDTT